MGDNEQGNQVTTDINSVWQIVSCLLLVQSLTGWCEGAVDAHFVSSGYKCQTFHASMFGISLA